MCSAGAGIERGDDGDADAVVSSRTSSRPGVGVEQRTLKFYQEILPGGASMTCGLLPDGSDYMGPIDFTRTGRRCARWDTYKFVQINVLL